MASKTLDKILNTGAEEKVQKPTPQSSVISPQMEEENKKRLEQEQTDLKAQRKEEKKAEEPIKTNADIYRAMNPYIAPTAEELEAERKKRRSKAIVNTLGDGLSALANMYFTTKGAPAVKYDPRSSLSERSKARWDKLDQMRDEKMTQYATGLANAEMADLKQRNAEKLLDKRAEMNEKETQSRAALHEQDAANRVKHTNLVQQYKAENTKKANPMGSNKKKNPMS